MIEQITHISQLNDIDRNTKTFFINQIYVQNNTVPADTSISDNNKYPELSAQVEEKDLFSEKNIITNTVNYVSKNKIIYYLSKITMNM